MHPALRKSDFSAVFLGPVPPHASAGSGPSPAFPTQRLPWPRPWTGQVFMLLWVSLLALASVIGQFEAAPDSVISLQPPWPITFQGQEVTLTCHGSSFESPGQTTWFHLHQDNETSRRTPGSTWVVRESGQYRCQAGRSRPSSPVHLTFSRASLILQAPPAVFEGDTVLLRCQGKVDSELHNKTLYRNGRALAWLGGRSGFLIHAAALRDNGAYHCTAEREAAASATSNTVEIQVQELFPRPVLTASPARPVEGDPVTLTCETQLPPQRQDVQLRFRFYRDNQPLGFGRSWSPELRIPTVRREDSESYWCQAETMIQSITKRSLKSYIPVQRVTASVHVYTRPAPDLVFEGQELVLTCSVTGIPEPVRISWFRSSRPVRTQASGRAELRIAKVEGGSAGEYYCVARTGHRSFSSQPVAISVKVPVSRPVLTLSPAGPWALEGDTMTFHCEARRGSAPILYQFFHEGALVRKLRAASSGGSSFSVSLTAEHSGSYHCTADNGLGAQPSEAESLSINVPVSRPVLTLSPPGPRALKGDVMTLHCEARRGSSYILYRFYCEDVVLGSRQAPSGAGASFRLALREEHSANYSCTADNGFGPPQRSEAVSLWVVAPVSRPVLTVGAPGARAAPGDVLRLHCEAPRGSPPILYRFYRGDDALGSSQAPSGGGASLNLSVTEEHSGNYSCEADNGLGAQRSEAVTLHVTVPASRPVLTVGAPGARALPGDVLRLHCEAPRGSPPILYQFYRGDDALGSSQAPSGGGASLNLSVTEEHSGNYSCEANNGLGAQRSEAVTLRVTVPASRPVLTVGAPGARAAPGDVLRLHCEAPRGSPPILYRFYRGDDALGSSQAPSGGGASLNLSVTEEHSGNYSCEADNGLGAQRSEAVTLHVTGLPRSRRGSAAAGVTGVLVSMAGLAALALLFSRWLLRKEGERPAIDPPSSPSAADPQEPTYHNVPAWLEMQPVYGNVNPKDVVYTEVRHVPEKHRRPVTTLPAPAPDMGGSVIYSQVKVASALASRPQLSAPSAPHR
ncbi:Fc receptor-like protein 5 isoform X4 [Rousettus aegyptiacus]|uniref:Fc receptor-like protein 5 isoform X4 n=1 Tax=Rousettus aegyptiacus TaxID=9407 RepID=UPI00168CC847|nr:Fc receptor-like protein 5 isoform X4 [Rousettus aegyptiacus]